MAYTMTYNSLLRDVRNYLERGFTEQSDPLVYEQLPMLVSMAQWRIITELKLQGFIAVVETELQPGQSVYDKPDGWRDTVSMTVDGTPIFSRSYEYLRNFWPDPAVQGSVDDPVEFYADYDYSHWLIAPTPYTTQTLEITYYSNPPMLGEDVQTNWITTWAPNLLLYATLLEATPFLKNDARIPVWQQMYDRAAQAFTIQDAEKITDRSTQRDAP